MRVGFDTKDVLSGHRRAGGYFRELLPQLLRQAEDEDQLLVLRSETDGDGGLGWLLRDSRLRQLSAPFRGRTSGRVWRRLSFPAVERLLAEAGSRSLLPLDVCHSLHAPLMPSRARRRVLTLPYLEPDPKALVDPPLRRSLRRADAVIVGAKTTERELAERLDRGRVKGASAVLRKVRVISPGIHDRYRAPPKSTDVETLCGRYPFLEESYLLAAGGAADAEHSLPFLLETCARGRTLDPSLPRLVVLAPSDHSTRIAELIGESDGDGNAFLVQDLDRELLPALYRGAEMLLYPAFDYAPGAVVVEAAACGVPTVAGRGCGAREQLLDVLVEPASSRSDAWAREIVDLHQASERRSELGHRGQALLADLTWERAASEHWKVYRG